MAAEQDEPVPVLTDNRLPRPSDYPCTGGYGGHWMVAEPRRPFDAGPFIRVCRYCGLRWRIGVGAVA